MRFPLRMDRETAEQTLGSILTHPTGGMPVLHCNRLVLGDRRIKSLGSARFPDDEFERKVAVPLPDSFTFEQFDRSKRRFFTLHAGLRGYGGELWEAVGGNGQVVETHHRDVAGNRKAGFAQRRNGSDRNGVITGE